ncbi:hypothetical protein [Streptosporangium sandarakinum]|uniref:hypothetical protein n=1 Tax=Streptosporangium sandarakinum TaxID=1260955 RepID=UPI003713BAAD
MDPSGAAAGLAGAAGRSDQGRRGAPAGGIWRPSPWPPGLADITANQLTVHSTGAVDDSAWTQGNRTLLTRVIGNAITHNHEGAWTPPPTAQQPGSSSGPADASSARSRPTDRRSPDEARPAAP